MTDTPAIQAPVTPPRARLSLGKKLLFCGVLVLMMAAGIEGLCWGVFWYKPHLERIRLFLLGEHAPEDTFQKCIGQPYLLYVPGPGYEDQNGLQHNDQGYRGAAVTMQRTPGVARVLCLGGSTTYGWTVGRADETYPAHLQKYLQSELPPGVQGIEVLNGGLPYGTSAEMLTHYHFKYHYFKPDLVVLNTGGNDGGAGQYRYFQPDYSHWRMPLHMPQTLPRWGRALLRSRLASLLTIQFVARTDRMSTDIIREEDPPPTCWYPRSIDGTALPPEMENPAFVHNLEALLDALARDGVKALIVPFRYAPESEDHPIYAQVQRNERSLRDIAARRNLIVAPFPVEAISPANWTDHCHLNAEGSAEKARHITPYARELLWPTEGSKGEPPPHRPSESMEEQEQR